MGEKIVVWRGVQLGGVYINMIIEMCEPQ